MVRLIQFLVLIVMLLGLTACPPCDCGNEEPFNLKDIPEDVVAKLYYKNDMVYTFKHSSETLIQYRCETQFIDSDNQRFSCGCDDPVINNQQEYIARLSTDYPTFNIVCNLNNSREPYYPLNISLGNAYFNIPLSEEDAGNILTIIEEISIDGKTYYDVYALGKPNADYNKIEIDSLYYNHDFGIIKIGKTNDEYYVRQD